jgi:Ser/Thr protein kinase RdoA (MazF antagonist)
MMNVNVMKMILDQYECGKEDTFAHQMAKKWDYDEKTLDLINASSNFAFEMKTNGVERILRVTHKSERSYEILLAELDFIHYLDSNGIPVAKPVHSNNNEIVEKLQTKQGIFHGIVFEKIQGRVIEMEEMEDWQIYEWGKMMAKMHNLSLKYKAHPERRRRYYDEDIDYWKQWIPKDEGRFLTKINELKDWVSKLAEDKNQYGFIHYDMSYDNFIWQGKKFSIIDFDDSAYYPFEADIAFAIDDIRTMKTSEQFLDAFIDGYTSQRKLRDSWRQEMEQFFVLEDFLKYARMRRAYYNVDPENHLPWSKRMSKRHALWFERVTKELDAYL